MLNTFFRGIFDTTQTAVIAPGEFLLCVGMALVLGLLLSCCVSFGARASRSFSAALALLPAVVCVVIMMVNGNVGTGVAVAGAFSLVRFRSAPGSAREIAAIFLAMAVGLVCGMGYLGYALLTSLVFGCAGMLYNRMDFGQRRHRERDRQLHITIPEELNYSEAFTDIFAEYTDSAELQLVKTTNMGSLYRLSYQLRLKNARGEKEMLDALRCRNGNLEISISMQENGNGEL